MFVSTLGSQEDESGWIGGRKPRCHGCIQKEKYIAACCASSNHGVDASQSRVLINGHRCCRHVASMQVNTCSLLLYQCVSVSSWIYLFKSRRLDLYVVFIELALRIVLLSVCFSLIQQKFKSVFPENNAHRYRWICHANTPSCSEWHESGSLSGVATVTMRNGSLWRVNWFTGFNFTWNWSFTQLDRNNWFVSILYQTYFFS